jgi:H/ACA ribonucleoprotein complex subunit 4
MMQINLFLQVEFLVGFLGDDLYKISETTIAPYGSPPDSRSVEQLLESSVVVINKQAGPSSHQVAAWLRDSFELKQTGHGGTLDPNVTGVLPISIGRASKAIKVMQESPKEYICLMKHNIKVDEKSVQKMFVEFTGPIYQIPPLQAAVKRELRIRRIYEIEMLEHTSKFTLFRVECEGGTYIRDSKCILPILKPLESMLVDLPVIVVKDSAVDALCHGADLGFPGVVSVSKKMKRGQLSFIRTARSEAIALARATVDADEIAASPKSKGKVARLERVIMERGTYPREWKSK